jgi:YD repeat-containing protein
LTGRWSDPSDPRLPGERLPYGAGSGSHALARSALGPITYDQTGARSSEGSRTLSWNDEGELLGVTSPSATAEYTYGFDGSRRARIASFADGRFSEALDYGGLAEIREGVLWKHVILRGERIATFLGTSIP